MNFDELKKIPKPPHIFQILMAGFDSITNHIWLICFPIILDIFLWLGPHLSVKQLVNDAFINLSNMPGALNTDTVELVAMNKEIWTTITERLNIFSLIRSYPVGIPSLMVSIQPIQNPFFTPITWEIHDIIELMYLGFIIPLLGITLGGLYFYFVAIAASNHDDIKCYSIADFLGLYGRVIALSFFWFGIFIAISMPGICFLSVFYFSGIGNENLGLYLAFGLMAWLAFPLLFTPHGIFLTKSSLISTIKMSIRLVRFTLPTSATFFLFILIISEGLNTLWRIPDQTSWLAVVGIVGHGFITTSLLAATFIYFQVASQWMETVMKQLQKAI